MSNLRVVWGDDADVRHVQSQSQELLHVGNDDLRFACKNREVNPHGEFIFRLFPSFPIIFS